jgi:NAD(P)-dependent dehydrogenase (short-subunit alcohol dehydrogenase family)
VVIDLSHTNILVTGASRGIGAAIARGLAEAGAGVAVHYRANRVGAERVRDESGVRSRVFQADLSDASEAARLFREVVSSFGRIDVVVNNAGIAVRTAPEAAVDEWTRIWDETLNVNLKSLALLSHLAVQHFLESGGGRFVNIASRAAFRGDTKEYLSYAASKGGVVSLTRSIARAYGKQGIRAFVVAPGFTRTDMARTFMDEYGEDLALNDIALETLTEPTDVAPIVTLLCSGLADHATGCTIDVNAGSYVH